MVESAPVPHWAKSFVSRGTMDDLASFSELVTKWNKSINLVGPRTLPDIWNRHIWDSAQLWPLAGPNASNWADFGSGGGFPGLILAIIAKHLQGDYTFTLVESDARKCAFLATVNRDLNLRAKIVNQRIETLDPLGADIITARALAPLSELLAMLKPHGHEGTSFLFPKGQKYQEELSTAQADKTFDAEIIPSQTDANAAILRIVL